MVMLDEPPSEVIDDGLKVAVAPAGKPTADRLTGWADPRISAVDTVALTELPGSTEAAAGDTETLKSLAAHSLSLPATLAAVQAAWTVLYSTEQRPCRSVAACRVYARAVLLGVVLFTYDVFEMK